MFSWTKRIKRELSAGQGYDEEADEEKERQR